MMKPKIRSLVIIKLELRLFSTLEPRNQFLPMMEPQKIDFLEQWSDKIALFLDTLIENSIFSKKKGIIPFDDRTKHNFSGDRIRKNRFFFLWLSYKLDFESFPTIELQTIPNSLNFQRVTFVIGRTLRIQRIIRVCRYIDRRTSDPVFTRRRKYQLRIRTVNRRFMSDVQTLR